jgi:hypothetical protein
MLNRNSRPWSGIARPRASATLPFFCSVYKGSPTITGSRSVTIAPPQTFARTDGRRVCNGALALADFVTPFDFNQVLNARRICSEALIPSRSHNASMCAKRSSSIRNVIVRLIGVIQVRHCKTSLTEDQDIGKQA